VKGVCWGTSSFPTPTAGNFTTDGSGTGSFTSSITGLSINPYYYVRAYATNAAGTAYGNQVVFQSAPVPNVSTEVITGIGTTFATSGGSCFNTSNQGTQQRGICWSTSPGPTLADNKTTDGSGDGSFTSNMTGLTPNTLYYVRAYGTNSTGTGYGEERTFTTSDINSLPQVLTYANTNVTATSAESGGQIVEQGGNVIIARGVVYSTSPSPTLADSYTTDGTGMGIYSSILSGLTPNTTYYVRAYATNSFGTSYGSEDDFTTSVGTATIKSLLKEQISLYPNPASGIIHLDINSLNSYYFELKIINANSITVYTEKTNNFNGNYNRMIDVSALPEGVYCMQIITGNGTFTDKVVIVK
jgi:hypothetical protein